MWVDKLLTEDLVDKGNAEGDCEIDCDGTALLTSRDRGGLN
jgi:hypothetical protein